MSIDNDVLMLQMTDQESSAIRDMLDDFPQFAEVMRDPGPWRDGARLIITDCLVYRSDPDRMLARMWAWMRIVAP